MVLTPHSEKVAATQRAAEKRVQQKEEIANKEAAKAAEDAKKIYDKEQVIAIVCSMLAVDKQRLLDIPSAVSKAKQVLDEINRQL